MIPIFPDFAKIFWRIRKFTYLCNPIHGHGSSYKSFAEIAQLVEHNLAKVGVASSSLVFRSSFSLTPVGLFSYISLFLGGPRTTIFCNFLSFSRIQIGLVRGPAFLFVPTVCSLIPCPSIPVICLSALFRWSGPMAYPVLHGTHLRRYAP